MDRILADQPGMREKHSPGRHSRKSRLGMLGILTLLLCLVFLAAGCSGRGAEEPEPQDSEMSQEQEPAPEEPAAPAVPDEEPAAEPEQEPEEEPASQEAAPEADASPASQAAAPGSAPMLAAEPLYFGGFGADEFYVIDQYVLYPVPADFVIPVQETLTSGQESFLDSGDQGYLAVGEDIMIGEPYEKRYWYLDDTNSQAALEQYASALEAAKASGEGHPAWLIHMNPGRIVEVSGTAVTGDGESVSFCTEDKTAAEAIGAYLRSASFYVSGAPEVFGEAVDTADSSLLVFLTFDSGVRYTLAEVDGSLYLASSDMSQHLLYPVGGEMLTSLVSRLEQEARASGRWETLNGEDAGDAKENPVTEKPVIYLYPQTETDVSIRLDFDGELTYTYPAYGDGWNVKAKPDGTLVNLSDNSTHYYLFWEGTARKDWTISEGFVVKGEETEQFLKEALSAMGLTPREYNDFITYWVPRMAGNPYNLISFSRDYEDVARLTVTPEPDSVIRVHMVWKGLDAPVEIPPQKLPVGKREGFTLVEWGGTCIG